MAWLQLSIEVKEDQAPLLELVLQNLGALSITLGDAADQPLLEPRPGEEKHWRQTRLTGLFTADQDPDHLRAALSQQLEQEICRTIQLDYLEDQPWERAWLKDYQPVLIGQRLWVGPEQMLQEAGERISVILDPGLAFGTGSHPTTALCLEWLDSQKLAGKTLIDYGCGSGILAIAALRLGASHAIAIDHDPQALQATEENARKNRVAERITLYTPQEAPPQPQDLVLANILAGPLIDLAETICNLLKPEGKIGLSGILLEQAAAVRQAYTPWIRLETDQRQKEWVLLKGTRI
jgi:ribosomal protein L11 methyltransferase